MEFCILASGSKGNSIYIKAGGVKILVDQGLSAREAQRRLGMIGVPPEEIDAIVITHEHADHIRGVEVWRKRFKTPIFANGGAMKCLSDDCRVNGAASRFDTGKCFDVGELKLYPYALSHDAFDPVGFVFEWKGRRVGLATDLGCATELVRQRLSGADAMIIESNHDPEMLINGPYPWQLKDRIRRNFGHLSNNQAAQLISEVAHRELKTLALAHISQQNNTAALVEKSARKAIDGHKNVKVVVATQDDVTEIISLK